MILTEYIHDIFIARCKDTGERPKKEEAAEFKKQIQEKCVGKRFIIEDDFDVRSENVFDLKETRIGPLAAAAISKVLRHTQNIFALDLYGNGN